ncbi:hypothetical protein [Mycetocola spongiae]|uniref:hypothetical protein n=1 Tax=Mycetocola spongiae TaxID=2859226 RepID=UPI001CF16C45|nr:hypothetical protein [Mycetocola spongiae]UCR89859.1 hypothetical protein KXZ72_04100 [Mycetocola spongiae]
MVLRTTGEHNNDLSAATSAAQAAQKAGIATTAAKKPAAKKPAAKKSATQKPAESAASAEPMPTPKSTPEGEPTVATPAAKKPAVKKSAAKKPAEKKPAEKKATEKKSAAKSPVKKSAAGAAAEKPATKKPAAEKPAAKTPAVKTPATAQAAGTAVPAKKKTAQKSAAPRAVEPSAATPARPKSPFERPVAEEATPAIPREAPSAPAPAPVPVDSVFRGPVEVTETGPIVRSTEDSDTVDLDVTVRIDARAKNSKPTPGIEPATEATPVHAPAGVSGKPAAMVADAPVEDTPVADTPVAAAPEKDTPVTETPVTETPVAETPAKKTPAAEAPVVETPAAQTPEVDTPAAVAPARSAAARNAAALLSGPRAAQPLSTTPGSRGEPGEDPEPVTRPVARIEPAGNRAEPATAPTPGAATPGTAAKIEEPVSEKPVPAEPAKDIAEPAEDIAEPAEDIDREDTESAGPAGPRSAESHSSDADPAQTSVSAPPRPRRRLPSLNPVRAVRRQFAPPGPRRTPNAGVQEEGIPLLELLGFPAEGDSAAVADGIHEQTRSSAHLNASVSPWGAEGPVVQPPRRSLRVPLVIAGGLILLCATLALAWVLIADAFSPSSVVSGYTGDLAAGNLEEALERAGIERGPEDVLLTDEVYRALPERITEARVVDTELSGSRARVSAELILASGGEPLRQEFTLERVGSFLGLLDRWEMSSPDPGTLSLENITVPERGDLTIAGVSLGDSPAARAPLRAFPGTYQIALAPSTAYRAEPVSVTVDALGVAAVAEALTPELTAAGRTSITTAVNTYLEECAASGELEPRGCPFGVRGSDLGLNYDNIQWTLQSTPELEIGEYTGADWRVETRRAGSASLSADTLNAQGQTIGKSGTRTPLAVNVIAEVTGFSGDAAILKIAAAPTTP